MKWKGQFEITVCTGGKCYTKIIDNMIMDTGLNYFAEGLIRSWYDKKGIQYIALGASDVLVQPTQTKLIDERFRKVVTKREITGTGISQCTFYIAPGEANFHIKEIGIFAEGSPTKDTGYLIARVLWDLDKTSLESIQIIRTDEIGRG